MSNLTEFARGQECTLRVPGVCNHDPETVVLHHTTFGAGMGQKNPCLAGYHVCSSCHSFVHGAKGGYEAEFNNRAALPRWELEALIRTLIRVDREFRVVRK